MENIVQTAPCDAPRLDKGSLELDREWLVTNALGGYASGTVCGVATRRYHGLLVAALHAPLGRTMMLNRLTERFRRDDGTEVTLAVEGRPGDARGEERDARLTEFRLEAGLPVWRFEEGGLAIERRLLLPHLQNTTYVSYRIVSGQGPVQLLIRPSVHFRPHDAAVDTAAPRPYRFTASGDQYEISASGYPPLRLTLQGPNARFTLDAAETAKVEYEIEASRGYEYTGDLWSPGLFRVTLANDQDVTLIASTETWERMLALTPADALRAERSRLGRLIRSARPQARGGPAATLVMAADQFLITPAGRVEDATRAQAAGEEIRTVIAGYHWFTDWGRDTMISLEGLTLCTGRIAEAGYILRTFAYYIRDGLIPNMFPEGHTQGLYNTADATLWFFHAIDRYLEASDDRETLYLLLPKLVEIVECHLRGTHFGIGVDHQDGLLRQGAPGYQLTWMDAKVGDWVVTPRRGKAVEINALWYNALCLLEGWVRDVRGAEAAEPYAEHAERAYQAFNERFWYKAGGYLYDVVDGEQGDDPACRPNQLFAIALKHAILDRPHWEPVVDVARKRLLTPVGLRSLAPGSPDYKPKYYGDLRARDAAYHQGTVWAWLIGPFIDAWVKLYPEKRVAARKFLEGFIPHLTGQACLGSISEIFDAEEPYIPRGCIAQAWSVAEVLRSWIKTAE